MNNFTTDNSDIIDFKQEINNEFQNNSFDSIKIWRMFQTKKSNLPNNQRIQNLSWRVNSISQSKKQFKIMKLQSKIQQKNLSLLKPSNHPTNEEFDYIEHIKKMTKEEFGDFNSFHPQQNDFHSSTNPISIYNQNNQNNGNIDYSPDAANSLTSNTNSIFSNNKYDHSLSISSQVSQKQQRSSISQQQPQSNTKQSISTEFDIEHFLNLDNKDSNNNKDFNEFDLLDLSKFDSINHQQQQQQQKSNSDKRSENFSLSNYINSLETALKEDNNKITNNATITPIFSNQTTINDTFTVPRNINYNVTMNPKLSHSLKEQMSCNSCGTTTTPLWRKSMSQNNENLILCNACGLFLKLHGNLSKRNVIGNKKIFNNNLNNNDDQMGEIFLNDNKRKQLPNQPPQQPPQQQFNQASQPQQPHRLPKQNVMQEEDYDWLKFGL